MDKLKHFWTLLFVAFAMCACDPSDPEGGDEVRIIGDNSFTVEADATTVNGGAPIAFVASGEWNASPVGEAAEWLTVTPESGAAGDNEITIACQPNTGSQRDGKVRIVCGESAAEITIHQKGVGGTEPDPGHDKPDPVTPFKGYVSRIVTTDESDYSNLGMGINWKFRNCYTQDFIYDDENRIIGIDYVTTSEDWNEEEGAWTAEDWARTESYRFDYSEPGKITATYTSDTALYVYELFLDDAGRIGRLIPDDSEGTYYDLSYDNDGHLVSIVWEGGSYDWEQHYSWDGGVLATITYPANPNYNLDYTGCYGDLPNGAVNIDINMFNPGSLDILNVCLMLRLTGESSDRLLATSPYSASSPEYPGPSNWQEPNVNEHVSFYDISSVFFDRNLHYDADPDGLVRTVTQYGEAVLYLVECDLVSTDQLYDPEYPELGYKCTATNLTTTEVSRSNVRSIVYRFEYRAN